MGSDNQANAFPASTQTTTLAPDGATLITRRSGSPVGFRLAPQTDTVDVWDLETSKQRFFKTRSRAGQQQATFSPDSRMIALWLHSDLNESSFDMVAAITGQELWSLPVRMCSNVTFSPDGVRCMVRRHVGPNPHLTMFEAATGRIDWEIAGGMTPFFAGDSFIILYPDDRQTPLKIVDVRANQLRDLRIADFERTYQPVMTPDGKHFILPGKQARIPAPGSWEEWAVKRWPAFFGDGTTCTLVMESATGREVFRVAGFGTIAQILSDDAATLLTVEENGADSVIRVWSVHPHRAWVAAVATAFGLVAAAWLIRRFRCRNKSQSVSRPAANAPPGS